MKHTITLIAIILILTGSAYGEAYFDNHPLSELRIVQVDPQEGTARVTAAGGGSAMVRVGDTIGQSAATIAKISKVFVSVQTSQDTTRLPVINTSNQGGNCIVFH